MYISCMQLNIHIILKCTRTIDVVVFFHEENLKILVYSVYYLISTISFYLRSSFWRLNHLAIKLTASSFTRSFFGRWTEWTPVTNIPDCSSPLLLSTIVANGSVRYTTHPFKNFLATLLQASTRSCKLEWHPRSSTQNLKNGRPRLQQMRPYDITAAEHLFHWLASLS